MDNNIKLAFEFAWNLSEQIITLSTLVLGFTATFAKEFRTEVSQCALALCFSWIFYIVSISFGIFSFMALTGEIMKANVSGIPVNAMYYARVQIVTFGIASVLIAVAGWRASQRK